MNLSPRAFLRGAFIAFGATVSTTLGLAQVSLTPGSLSYSQNFDHAWTASDTPSAVTWTDNSTLPGWFLYSTGTSQASVSTQATVSGTSVGPMVFISHSTDPTDFILGARISDTNAGTPGGSNGYYYGLLLTNNTGVTITSFSLSYTGAQFYRSTGTSANTISVGYRFVADPLTVTDTSYASGTWTTLAGLQFTAPLTAAGTGTGINFNSASNRTEFSAAEVTGLSWAAGESLLVRWYAPNASGVDQGVGIDNVQFTAIPEPSTYAALLGLAGLALVASRRRGPRV